MRRFDTMKETITDKDNTMQDEPIIEEVPYEEMHLIDLLEEDED